MIYGSVCSGIEAATLAWHGLDWRPAWFAEIAPFPSAVLAHHYPEVHNYGDFTKIPADAPPIELLVGGTPCQSFSVAGLRGGMADARGNLAIDFLRLAERLRPRWLVWENVPGVLSSWTDAPCETCGAGAAESCKHERYQTNDFDQFLAGVGEIGYGWAYRILDAQYFGVPQRRRRVLLVGHLGDWRAPASVLFEPHSLSGNPPPSRKKGQAIAGPIGGSSQSGGFRTTDLDNNGAYITETIEPILAYSLTAQEGKRLDGESCTFVPVSFAQNRRGEVVTSEIMPSLGQAGGKPGQGYPALAEPRSVSLRGREGGSTAELGGDVVPAIRTGGGGGDKPHVLSTMRVRRLTPRECERLQGMPDDWTLVPWRNGFAPDTPRYAAIGNSMAVPKMAWLGRQIAAVDRILHLQEEACT